MQQNLLFQQINLFQITKTAYKYKHMMYVVDIK